MRSRNHYVPFLPHEVVIRILSFVGKGQQICRASAVCKTWKSAALMMLDSMEVHVTRTNCSLMASWLKSKSGQLRHLELTYVPDSLPIQLPSKHRLQLRSLKLQGGMFLFQGVSSDAMLGMAHTLTSLTLCEVRADIYSQLLGRIAGLSELRSLQIDDLNWDPARQPGNKPKFASSANKVWKNLTHLTALQLTNGRLDKAAMRHITRLSSLKHLNLEDMHLSKPRTLLPLSADLTYLNLAHNHRQLDFSQVLAHQSLPALQYLDISGLILSSPSQLWTLTNLKHLHLNKASLRDDQQLLYVLQELGSLRALSMRGVFGTDYGVHADDLERALQLPRLTMLDLSGNYIVTRQNTAFNSVDVLIPRVLSDTEILYADAREDLAPVFFSGCSMPELQKLDLSAFGYGPKEAFCGVPELKALVEMFPKLRELNLQNRVNPNMR